MRGASLGTCRKMQQVTTVKGEASKRRGRCQDEWRVECGKWQVGAGVQVQGANGEGRGARLTSTHRGTACLIGFLLRQFKFGNCLGVLGAPLTKGTACRAPTGVGRVSGVGGVAPDPNRNRRDRALEGLVV